jgi:cytochrome c
MKYLSIAAAFGALMAGPAFAGGHIGPGDPAAGEAVFSQCQSCHNIVDDGGEVLAGRANVRTGPNLYGVVGRQAGSLDGFRYRPDIVAAGEAGLVWDAESLIAYAQDPQTFLRETLDKNNARSGMAYRVRSEEEAANVVAYIASLAPPPEG